MEHQDWNTIIFYKKDKNNNNTDKTIKKKTIKNSSNTNDINMRKLDEETENFEIKKVSFDLKTNILKARCAKKITQKQLAQLINEKPAVIISYENGTAIPNNSIIMKMQKVLGVKLR